VTDIRHQRRVVGSNLTAAGRTLAAAALAWMVLGGSVAGDQGVRADAASVPPLSKVAVLFLENQGYRDVIGSPDAPFLNRLARRGALETRYYAVGHPSLPNYLALMTGSTQGVRSDCNSCDTSARSLPAQLEAAHISWKAYFEGIPSAGFAGDGVGDYSKHYNPFAYSEQVGEGAAARAHVVGFDSLRSDLHAGTLPRFSWIGPDLLHDGHNGSVNASDRFVSKLVPRIVRRLGPHGVLFVTWDEAYGLTGPRGGRVALIATGPGARHHARVRTWADHYSLLATLEAGFRLPPLGHAATSSLQLLTGLLRRSASTPLPSTSGT
jgi:phosphatidylinositol-3-phosphatase